MSIVIPDSITPYEGYKYLRVQSDGEPVLYSPQSNTRWAPGKPLKAICDFGWGFTMRPVEQATRVVSWKRELEDMVSTTSGSVEWLETRATIETISPTGETQFWVTREPFSGVPATILPSNMAWSYEPRPCPHDPVAEGCTCGIYVVNTPKQAEAYRNRHTSMALVRIALWGRVIRGDKGARGQYAYPIEIVDRYNHGKSAPTSAISERYGLTQPEPTVPTWTEQSTLSPETIRPRPMKSGAKWFPRRGEST